MKRDFGLADLGETERPFELLALLFYAEFPARPIRVGEAIIAILPFEAGIARLLATLHTAEEAGKGPIKPPQDILQHVGGNLLVFFAHLCFDFWYGILLLVVI